MFCRILCDRKRRKISVKKDFNLGLFDKEGKDAILGKLQKATDGFFANTEFKIESNQNNEQPKFCTECGTKLNEGEKFCHNCGISLTFNVQSSTQPPTVPAQSPNEAVAHKNSSERKQEYVGKIEKCPNCGCTIYDTTAICPDCGFQITGRSANMSVQDFKNQLMALENSRKGGLGGAIGGYFAPDKADVQKLTLIRSYPIPNSVGDILEFMMLTIANIDVSLSKNTVSNRFNNATQQTETGATIKRTISNAWVSKMEQVYHKAEILFPNDPSFKSIQKMYYDKMKELKIKVK